MYLNFWFKFNQCNICHTTIIYKDNSTSSNVLWVRPQRTPALPGPAVCSATSLCSCSSHFSPSYSLCSNSLASFLYLRCVRPFSDPRLLHLLFLLPEILCPSFPHDPFICVLQVSDLLPLLRVAFLEWWPPTAALHHTPVHFLHSAVCNDFIGLFTYHVPASPSKP